MTIDEIIAYCLEKKSSYVDYPFGDIPICVKVHNRIFAQVYPKLTDYKVTLKCQPMMGDFYRQLYPNTVVRGYHCPPIQQPYWNTIYLNGIVTDDELKTMIDQAYNAVVLKLPKNLQKEISEE